MPAGLIGVLGEAWAGHLIDVEWQQRAAAAMN